MKEGEGITIEESLKMESEDDGMRKLKRHEFAKFGALD